MNVFSKFLLLIFIGIVHFSCLHEEELSSPKVSIDQLEAIVLDQIEANGNNLSLEELSIILENHGYPISNWSIKNSTEIERHGRTEDVECATGCNYSDGTCYCSTWCDDGFFRITVLDCPT